VAVSGPADDDTTSQLREAIAAFEAPAQGGIAGSEVVWLGRNVDRIDARLRDADGREHHVVGRAGPRGLTVELLLSEPDDVPARDPIVVVVNGPSGSGKSTLLGAIAELSDAPWVTFDEPILGSTDPSVLVWPERAPTIHTGFLDGISAVAAAGNAVAAAAGGHSQERFRASLRDIRTVYVGLDCPMPVLLEREHGREGRWGGLARQSANAHEGWSYDLRVDTSRTSPHEAAGAVLARTR
jgi:chloramphenicol 3-O-phosphotransferase